MHLLSIRFRFIIVFFASLSGLTYLCEANVSQLSEKDVASKIERKQAKLITIQGMIELLEKKVQERQARIQHIRKDLSRLITPILHFSRGISGAHGGSHNPLSQEKIVAFQVLMRSFLAHKKLLQQDQRDLVEHRQLMKAKQVEKEHKAKKLAYYEKLKKDMEEESKRQTQQEKKEGEREDLIKKEAVIQPDGGVESIDLNDDRSSSSDSLPALPSLKNRPKDLAIHKRTASTTASNSFSSVSEVKGSKVSVQKETDTKVIPDRDPYLFKKPVLSTAVISTFGKRAYYDTDRDYGAIYKALPGSLVVAPMSGTITFVGSFLSYGNVVMLKTKDKYDVFMAGFKYISVKKGDVVLQGEKVGSMPDEAADLYVEVREKGLALNTDLWLHRETKNR